MHRPRLGLVGDLDLVAAQAEHVPHPEQPPAEQIGLQGEPVAVATTHVDDRIDALSERDRRRRPGRHPGACAGVVAELDEVECVADLAQLAADVRSVGPWQRPEAYGQDRPVQDRLGDGAVTCVDSQAKEVTAVHSISAAQLDAGDDLGGGRFEPERGRDEGPHCTSVLRVGAKAPDAGSGAFAHPRQDGSGPKKPPKRTGRAAAPRARKPRKMPAF